MNDTKKYNLEANIPEVEPFVVPVSVDEEKFFRHIISQVNKVWTNIHMANTRENPSVTLAKTALYFAEMYYRRSAMLNEQTKLLENFEERVDRLLLLFDQAESQPGTPAPPTV